tara:strand:+ start:390 stop:707 length:318 start_codon:yes stop_codon:yes gene_type:complete
MAAEEPGIDLLTKLGEAGGITTMVGGVIMLILKMIKKNGCTFRCYGCTGKPLMEVDCEEGSATKRYFPKAASPPPSESSEEAPKVTRGVRPSDVTVSKASESEEP